MGDLDKKIESARHKEVLESFKRMTEAITKNSNDPVSKAIENNTKEIGNFGKKLGELQVKVEAPVVNVQTNQQTVVDALKELKDQGGRIEQLLKKQNEYFEEMCKPKEYEFEFGRNQWGVMQSPIKAKVKSNKSKYQA